MTKFEELGLSQETIDILIKKGFTEPTEIQAKAIPLLLNGTKDIIGKSQTGTGKTAGFALPIIEMLKPGSHVKALILTPTRELAIQVKNEFDSLKGSKNVSTLTVYGGSPISKQISKLREGVDIVVGTPGRVIDMIQRRALKLNDVDHIVLDEADEMLNMGFIDDIKQILESAKKDRQMLLFSATMPNGILKIAQEFMGKYELIDIKGEQVTTLLTQQIYYDINPKDRIECLKRVIDITPDFYGIVFCKTKARVDFVAGKLSDYKAEALHGDISQDRREKILGQFRQKKINVLVATDVAARGIDVNDLTHVINFSLPQSPELYVHRIGRTGRAGKNGIAITFVMPSERRMLKMVERIVKQKLTKGEIPAIKDVFESKKKKGIEAIRNIIKHSKSSDRFTKLAEELMESYDNKEVIIALLQFGFKNEFSEIGEISEVKERSERNRESGRFNRRGPRGNGSFNRSRKSGSGFSKSKTGFKRSDSGFKKSGFKRSDTGRLNSGYDRSDSGFNKSGSDNRKSETGYIKKASGFKKSDSRHRKSNFSKQKTEHNYKSSSEKSGSDFKKKDSGFRKSNSGYKKTKKPRHRDRKKD